MLSFVFPYTSMTVLKMFSNTFFSMCMTSKLWRRRLVFQLGSSQKILRFTQLWVKPKPRNFCLPDWRPNTMSRTLTQHQTILYRKDAGVQHPFQLFQQRNHLCSFYTCDSATRNDGDSKKKEALPPFVSVDALLFSIQYGHASFSCVLQPETIP